MTVWPVWMKILPYANYTISPEEVLRREPLIKKKGLQGAGVYLDYRNNDARLVIDNIKKAVEDGAQAISKMKVIDFIYTDGQISGIRARDLLTDQVIEVKAKLVINTSGPWVDKIRYLNFTPSHRAQNASNKRCPSCSRCGQIACTTTNLF